MKEQENMIMKYQFKNYSLSYLELNNDLPIIVATMIISKMAQTFIQNIHMII